MQGFSRRQVLQILGAGAVGIGCGSETGQEKGSQHGSLAHPATSEPTGLQMLAQIDTIVVVMMENRSFDHYFGALKRDAAYPNAGSVTGTSGTESNPAPTGPEVVIHPAETFTLADPPHSFDASHKQFNGGKNDQFVIVHEGPNQNQVMAYYDRTQIPFYYWLADNFTVCDHWHASVMGPTWPNRLYLHAGTSAGKKNNTPNILTPPKTIWEQMRAAGKSTKNYYAGSTPFLPGALPTKLGVTTFAKMDKFFADAKAGTLPALSYIDPDWSVSDDHPAHDIRLGQSFVSSIYKALSESPQWSRSLMILIYDEHGGFWDHVAPPVAPDDRADFRQFGFRVPAILIGPTVKKGHLSTTAYDHTSVLATVAARFGLPALTTRSAAANALTDIFDPARFDNPAPPPANPPVIELDAAALSTIGVSSQEELDDAIQNGTIPSHIVDERPHDARIQSWLREAESLGAVRFIR
ncbi:alkaline phosphatase family protein [Pendulispora brunnea]|uniref:Alkaline phosphatase family protein n=1 Tax=Pendulispora brunnea TaxID=2905690 RepID=A0ABZ2KCJ1_9BACT